MKKGKRRQKTEVTRKRKTIPVGHSLDLLAAFDGTHSLHPAKVGVNARRGQRHSLLNFTHVCVCVRACVYECAADRLEIKNDLCCQRRPRMFVLTIKL